MDGHNWELLDFCKEIKSLETKHSHLILSGTLPVLKLKGNSNSKNLWNNVNVN